MKILVADDSRVAREALRARLSSLGHAPTAVEDGQAALAAVESEPFPIVISDWTMPGVSGLELCRAVRAREAARLAADQPRSYTYFILLTARSTRADYVDAMAGGADDFLTKPVDEDQLAARLHVAERILGLQGEIEQLSGLLPICAFCKKVREGDADAPAEAARWVRIETYVSQRSSASFSHGVCPECRARHVQPQIDELRQQKAQDRRP
jgi:phosphoserine phosphatase RsbU/P